MKKALLKIILKTFASSLLTTLFGLTALLMFQPNDDASLHFNATGMIYGIGVLYNLLMLIFSTSIFLNDKHKIREYSFFSMLTFLLIPFLSGLLIVLLTFKGFDKNFWTLFVITIPYLTIMTFQFINFRMRKLPNLK